jgi:ABC-2 type transport system permease protein
MAGPPVGLDTLAGIMMYESWITAIAGTCILATLMVSRHTRAEEELGRTELVRAAEVGRHAGAAAALLVTGGTCLLIGIGLILTLGGTPLGWEASIAYAGAVVALGLTQATTTLCLAQLFDHARAVTSAGLVALLVAYVVRAIGDVRESWVVWLSPVGWVQQMRIPVENRYWPLLVCLSAWLLLGGLAVRLAEHRDFGGGLVPERARRGTASAALGGPVGLAMRLQRGPLLIWSASLAATGALIGALGDSMLSMIEDNPQLADYMAVTEGGSVIDAYQSTFALVMALGVGGYAVWSAGHLRPEEDQGRLELMLAGPLRRTRSLLGHLVVTLGGVALLVAVGGLSTAAGYTAFAGDAKQGWSFAGATFAYLPAIFTLVAVVAVVYGWLPRWTWVGWLVFAFDAVIGWLGGLLQPPGWVSDLSAFTHVPRIPMEPFTWGPWVALAALACLGVAAGCAGFVRRDIG